MHSGLGNVSQWHASIQSEFPREMCERYSEDGLHRTDVMLNDGFVIEVQNSPISAANASRRTDDWNREGKQVVWILNGVSCGAYVWRKKTDDAPHYSLHFKKPALVSHFVKNDFVLIDIESIIYIVRPSDMRNGYVHSANGWMIQDMVAILQDGPRFKAEVNDARVDVPLGECIVWQYPPGSGKTTGFTRGIIEEVDMDHVQFDKYGVVIVLTKEHSAKEVAYNKFKSLKDKFGAVIIKESEKDRGYTLKYSTTKCNERCLIIATLDSFIRKLADPHPAVLDMFSAILRNVEEKNSATGLGDKGGTCLKGQPVCINAQCLIIIDESTKPANTYRPTLDILRQTMGVSLLIVGDKLQSTNNEINLMTEVLDGTFAPNGFMAPKIVHKNVINRFGDRVVSLLKHMIDYESYNVKVPEANPSAPDTTVNVFTLGRDHDNNMLAIRKRFEDDIDKYWLLPRDVLGVAIFVKTCDMTHESEHMFDDVWSTRFANDEWVTNMRAHLTANLSEATNADARSEANERLEYFEGILRKTKFAMLHFSDYNQTINTKSSKDITRIVSIQSSQGDERRYCIVLGLNETKLTHYFTEGLRGLKYSSLIQVALSRAKEHLVVYIDNVYDGIWEGMKKAGYVLDCEDIEPTLSLTKCVDFSNLSSFPTCSDDVSEIIQTTMTPVMNDAQQNPTLDFVHHTIRAAAYRIQFFYCAIVNKRVDGAQFIAKAHTLKKIDIKTWNTHRDYYKALRLRDDKTLMIPLLFKPLRRRAYNAILATMRNAKTQFKNIVEGKQPCWKTSSDDNDVILLFVVMWHMIDIENCGGYNCKISTVYDIADALHNHTNDAFDIATFYETLKHATDSYDKLCTDLSDETNWLMNHKVTFGKKNGRALTEFTAYVVMDFVIEVEDRVRVIMLRPHVSMMTMANVAFTSIFIRRILSQPFTDDNSNKRFCSKPIDVVFVETSTGELINIPDIKLNETQVTDIMVEQIRDTMTARHTSIAQFCAFWEDRERAFEKYMQVTQTKNPPQYVQDAVTYKNKRTRGCEAEDYEEDLRNSRDDHLDQFKDDARRQRIQ